MLAALAHLLAQQQLATGMVGAAAAGSVLFSLKAIPGQLWTWLKDQVFVTLVIEGTDPIYDRFGVWFARKGLSRRARRLMLVDEYDHDAGEWRWTPTLGRGWHLGWLGARPVLINREIEQGGELAKLIGKGAANQRLWLLTFGRAQDAMRRLIRQVEEIYNADGLVRIFFWADGCFRIADRRRPRPFDTVYLPATQKARVAGDLRRFLGERDSYERRGTPFRRGYLFEGPPGTGKTSLIFALAGEIGRDVYAINLANVHSDNSLMAAFNEVPSSGVVVVEDIDTVDITKDRALVEAEKEKSPLGALKIGSSGACLTLSGLLNAVDGLAAREGRILFVTSNAPEKLDSALLRAGRIDLREKIDLLGREPAFAMYQAFSERPSLEEFERLVAPHLPMAGAALQNLLQGEPRPHLEWVNPAPPADRHGMLKKGL